MGTFPTFWRLPNKISWKHIIIVAIYEQRAYQFIYRFRSLFVWMCNASRETLSHITQKLSFILTFVICIKLTQRTELTGRRRLGVDTMWFHQCLDQSFRIRGILYVLNFDSLSSLILKITIAQSNNIIEFRKALFGEHLIWVHFVPLSNCTEEKFVAFTSFEDYVGGGLE